jgi:hypothetical protein
MADKYLTDEEWIDQIAEAILQPPNKNNPDGNGGLSVEEYLRVIGFPGSEFNLKLREAVRRRQEKQGGN